MHKKLTIGLLMIWVCSLLFACSPSQGQIDSLSTEIAGEIHANLTTEAKQQECIIPSSSPTVFPTPLNTVTLTPTQVVYEASPVAPIIGLPTGTDGYPWWNDSIFYEIYVRSFYDSDADGIGDLNGITEKLDYLNDGDPSTTSDLGISGLWLMPIFPSPTTHKYNTTDFYDIDPEYGTMADFENLLESAHERGIRIILDLSVNVTSNQHPWFVEGTDPASEYHDWYIWSDFDAGYTGSWGQQVWFPVNDRYFYSTYSPYSPDLNLENPDATDEMLNIARFWIEDVGVDGFRLDSAKHLIEEGTIQANSESTHRWLRNFFTFYKKINPQAMTVGEVWDDTMTNASYIIGDEFDISFEFSLAGAIIESVNEGVADEVNDQVWRSYSTIPNMRFGSFLSNHDMERVMSQFFDDDNKAKVAASLLLTAPGVPFIYYGEEIGMQGDQTHEWFRRPMQWSDEMYAGFSNMSPWQPVGPGWEEYNVAVEAEDSESILSHYQALIQIRNEHAALRVGDLEVLTTTDEEIYAILRAYEDEIILVLINLGNEPVQNIWITKDESILPEGELVPVPILGEDTLSPIEAYDHGALFHILQTLEFAPYGTYIYQLHPTMP